MGNKVFMLADTFGLDILTSLTYRQTYLNQILASGPNLNQVQKVETKRSNAINRTSDDRNSQLVLTASPTVDTDV